MKRALHNGSPALYNLLMDGGNETYVKSNLGWEERLADTVRVRRKALRLTQPDLAALAECSVPFVVALERGKPTTRLDKVVDVLTVLGLHLKIEAGRRGVA